jgi:HK97 gp10 family phage protein
MEVRITGGKQLHDLLQQLPVEVETKILRAAMGRAARVLRDEARAMAPLESGDMKKSIKSTRNTKKGQVIAKVKMLGKHSFLGLFMEYGVSPHVITAKPGRVLRIGRNSVGKSVKHPGHAARPFLRPALDTNAPRIVQLVTDYMTKYLAFGTIVVPEVSVDVEEDA